MRFLNILLLSVTTASAADVFEASVKPFLRRNCVGCHGTKNASGGMSVEAFLAQPAATALRDRERWERIAYKIRSGEMPPKGASRPRASEVRAVAEWIDGEYLRLDRNAPADPGSVTLRRLNRNEYSNSVRDLLQVDMRPGDDLPADPYGYGFDNIGDVLSMSPVLAERYLKAAERISKVVIPIDGETVPPTMERYLAERMAQDEQLHLTVDHVFPADGEYTLRSAWYQALKDGTKVKLRLFVDGREVASGVLSFYYQIDRALDAPGVRITAGRHRVEAKIEVLPDPPYKGNPPYLEYLQIYGPSKLTPSAGIATYSQLMPCSGGPGCARKVLEPLATRAYRRPVTAGEMDDLLSLASATEKRTGSFAKSMRVGLQAILVSPNFLFRVEQGSLDEYELASRLSYFLWSSLPDEELLRLAGAGRLRAGIVGQVKRMMADARSSALVENFAGQWLQTRNLSVLKPDRKKFPGYNSDLRDDFRTETELFFAEIMREDRSILEFIDGKFSYWNERLARHYGVDGVSGAQFRRVELDGVQRSGVLTHASVLTVSSYPTRTSPVIRGKWVLENILNAPPPPPPPEVPPLDEQAVGNAGSLRQQLEKHRANAVCASCHARMDPLGFGLENYDGTGKWRTMDGKFAVDASGSLPDGRSFQSPEELKGILRADAGAFTRGFVEKMLTYALGRGLEMRDRGAVRKIVDRVESREQRFSEVVLGVVESVPFQMREAGTASKPDVK